MIWATVSSRSCFCRLYWASLSSAAKNRINLIPVLTIRWCPGLKLSQVVGKECLLWPVCSLYRALLPFPLVYFIFQGQTWLLFQVSLNFLLLHSYSLWWKGYLFSISSRMSHRSFIERFSFSFFGISSWGIVLDYCTIEWFTLEMNWDHSVIFEAAPRYYILDSFVVYEDCSTSSKGFLPTVVGVMVIWIKFPHSYPF